MNIKIILTQYKTSNSLKIIKDDTIGHILVAINSP